MSHSNRTGFALQLWPEPYAVARLRRPPDPWPRLDAAAPPVAVVIGNGEVSVIAPEAAVDALGEIVEKASRGWRAITIDAVLPLETVGVLAAVSRALADVGIPVMAFASHDTDHFLVPAASLGRALAALGSARLERLVRSD